MTAGRAGEFREHPGINLEKQQTTSVFSVDGLMCPAFQLQGKVAKQFLGYTLIGADLEDALRWLRLAHELTPKRAAPDDGAVTLGIGLTKPEPARKAFFYAAVITYGRCFASADYRGTVLKATDHVPGSLRAVHEKIIDYRDKLVAHAGSDLDSGEVFVALHPDRQTFHVAPHTRQFEFDDDRRAKPDFEALIVRMIEIARQRAEEKLKKLVQSDAREAAKKHLEKLVAEGKDHWPPFEDVALRPGRGGP